MKGAALKFGALWVLACAAATPARAADVVVTDVDRTFGSFVREAATVGEGRIRLEVRGMTAENDRDPRLTLAGEPADNFERLRNICKSHTDARCADPNNDFELDKVQGGWVDFLGSYGLGKSAELGFDVPLYIQKSRFLKATNGTATKPEMEHSINNTNVGDVMLYGKFKREVVPHCSLAGGLELTLPTGIERDGFGTGEVGFNPFVSARYTYKRFGAGAHLGYNIYTGPPADRLNWSVEALVRGGQTYAFRLELAGRYFKDFGDEFKDVVLLPGIDFYISDNFVVRPTGLANVTSDALDWGVGVGVAFTL